MKKLLLITLFLISFLIKGQTSCNSTITPVDIFYPNTVSTPTIVNGYQYLCGPNTVVYDTIGNPCQTGIYVNAGSILFFDKGCPLSTSFIWLKNNSTLNLKGGSTYGANVYYEPTAIINNPTGVPINSVACTSISFPTVSCTTIITDKVKQESIFLVYPNPSSSQINIETINFNYNIADISIFNQFGKLVLRKEDWRVSGKEINIDSLSGGLYFIQIKTSQGQQTEKFIINR